MRPALSRLYASADRPALDRPVAPELYTIAAVLLSSVLLLALLTLASKVLTGNATAYDWAVLLALRNPADLTDPIGPDWFESIVVDLSTLGGAPVLGTLALVAVGYFLIARKREDALLLVASVGGTVGLNTALKVLVARPGFNLGLLKYDTSTFSFPSGHAAVSAATFLTLGALMAHSQSNPYMKSYVLAVATALTLIVGANRVFQGVHYPTDVLAGWALGATWALLCLLAYASRARG